MEEKLSESLEDYLEIIYNKILENNTVRAIDISRALNVSRASVTDALNRLSDKGYINYQKYGQVLITEIGIKKAKQITSLHKNLTEFFINLGVEQKIAEDVACKTEHIFPLPVQKRVNDFNNFCKNNPNFKF